MDENFGAADCCEQANVGGAEYGALGDCDVAGAYVVALFADKFAAAHGFECGHAFPAAVGPSEGDDGVGEGG